MAQTLLIFVFALLCTSIFAIPTKPLRKRSFKVTRVEQKNYVPNGRAAMKRAYLKFGLGDIDFNPDGEVAAKIKAASDTAVNGPGTEDGTTPATGTQNDAQFLSPVTVGGQRLVMNFDSGSSDMYVAIIR